MLKICRAVRKNLITQKFGRENTAPNLLPIYKSYGLIAHEGWDFSVSCKDNSAKTGGQCENVYCDISNGAEITYISQDIKSGYGIIAIDDNGDKHLWWHLENINPVLRVGHKIGGGTLIGQAGNTGTSTGAHLHRAYYRWDEPQDNNYGGACDIAPYFINIFILDYLDNLKAQISILQKIIDLWKQIKLLITTR